MVIASIEFKLTGHTDIPHYNAQGRRRMVIKSIRVYFYVTAICLGIATSSSAVAVPHFFSVTFDGTNQSVDGISDPMLGTNIAVGDNVLINAHAAGNDFWSIDANTNFVLDNALRMLEGAQRTVDTRIDFLLDGLLQHSQGPQLEVQANVHMGGPNTVPLTAGLLFDEVVIDFDFLNSTSVSNTINSDGLFWNWWTNDPEVTYHQVPEPSALALLGLGLLGIGVVRRKIA